MEAMKNAKHTLVSTSQRIGEVRRHTKETDVRVKLNLDGGGSTCLLVNGKETVHPSDPGGERPLPTVFLIKLK